MEWIGIAAAVMVMIVFGRLATRHQKSENPNAPLKKNFDAGSVTFSLHSEITPAATNAYRTHHNIGRYTDGCTDELGIVPGGAADIRIPLQITYLSSNGEITYRRIDVLAFSEAQTPDGVIVPCYLTAFCHIRNARRMFRADRILDAHNPESGEDIADLGAYLSKKAPLHPQEPKHAGNSVEPPNSRRREPSHNTILILISPRNLTVGYKDHGELETCVGTVESFTYVVNQRVTVVVDVNIRRAFDQKMQVVKYRQITSATDLASGSAIPGLGEWLWSHRIH